MSNRMPMVALVALIAGAAVFAPARTVLAMQATCSASISCSSHDVGGQTVGGGSCACSGAGPTCTARCSALGTPGCNCGE